jgi:murein DD-endopeptidase MepM/ murein hydrolase activator NlpD
MAVPTSSGRLPLRVRRAAAFVLLPLVTLPLLLIPGAPAAATPPNAQSLDDLRLKEREAAADLEDSSAQVQAAGAALRAVERQLSAAHRAVARATGKLAGARAKAAAATAEVRRAEAEAQQAERKVAVASDQVDEGREEVGRLARRTYQRGRLSDLRDVMEAGEPQDALLRAGMLRSVFRSQNDSLSQLTQDRLELAGTRAELAADERALERARERAEQGAARAREVAVQAEQAARKVQDLAAQRRAVLASAEKHRAEDLQDYQQAQAASRALAERIRAAAAKAAAQRAAADRSKKAAEEAERKRRERAGQKPAAPQAERRSDRMLWPAPGRLSSRYGYRRHPIYGDRRMHNGIDIAAPDGTRVSAAESGVVTFAGYAGGFGNFVVVSHRTVDGRDLSTAYAHMESIAVREGQLVDRGDRVGAVGNTGNSTGNHLHFEVRLGGDPVDPLDYVDQP